MNSKAGRVLKTAAVGLAGAIVAIAGAIVAIAVLTPSPWRNSREDG